MSSAINEISRGKADGQTLKRSGVISVIAVLFLGCWCAQAAAQIALQVVGGTKTAFLWHESRCDPHFIPDAPARAFFGSDGRIVLMASSQDNWILIGRSMDLLRADCHSVLPSSERAQVDGLMWIEATHSEDGKIVDALASRAIPDTRRQGCNRPAPGGCWLNDIIAASSVDGARSFRAGEVVASLARRYDPDQVGRIGFFTTSNIVSNQGWLYGFVFFDLGNGISGNCLIRTQNIHDAASWRAWDGRTFSIPVRAVSGSYPPCNAVSHDILTHEVRSLSYITSRRLWVAVYADRLRLKTDSEPVAGIYMSTSVDLIHWRHSLRIMSAPLERDASTCNEFISYPSLIDPLSKSRNFDTIDHETARLFFTYHHIKSCAGSYNRDLDYVPLRIIDINSSEEN